MKISIISLGDKIPNWAKEAINQYLKRLPNDFNVIIKAIKTEKRYNNCNINNIILKEEQKIKSLLTKKDYLVCLDEKGLSITSYNLSKLLDDWITTNINPVFIIGGPDGLSCQFKKNSNKIIKLSSLTLPHHLARVLLVEQIFRAHSILNNSPYHRY